MMVQDEESGKRRDDNGRQEDGRRGEWREEVEGLLLLYKQRGGFLTVVFYIPLSPVDWIANSRAGGETQMESMDRRDAYSWTIAPSHPHTRFAFPLHPPSVSGIARWLFSDPGHVE